MAAFPEEPYGPYGVAGFHKWRRPATKWRRPASTTRPPTPSRRCRPTATPATDDDDGSFTTTTTTRRTLNDDEDWWRDGKAALDAAAAAAAPAEALAGAMREYGADPRLAVRGAHRLEAHYASAGLEGLHECDARGVGRGDGTFGALRRADSSGASALQACAAACASSRPSGGAVFIDRLAAHGGLACVLLETLSTHPDDVEVQRAGLGILGHARLLDREASAGD